MGLIKSLALALPLSLVMLISCKTKFVLSQNHDMSWKESVIFEFVDRYTMYQNSFQKICAPKERNFYYDFARKIQSIREYPFEEVQNELQKYVKSNKIEFDSILMLNISEPEIETIENTCPTTYMAFISKGKVKTFSIGLDFCEKIIYWEEVDYKNNFEKIKNLKQDGCSVGYICETWFDREFKWKIGRISINPDK